MWDAIGELCSLTMTLVLVEGQGGIRIDDESSACATHQRNAILHRVAADYAILVSVDQRGWRDILGCGHLSAVRLACSSDDRPPIDRRRSRFASVRNAP